MTITAAELVAEAKKNIREVGVETLATRLGQAPIVIDVREPAEFQKGHVYGAVNIPRGVLEFEVLASPAVDFVTASELQVHDAPIYLYCRSGGRSALCAESLQRMGFTDVMSVAGGFLAWEAADLPIQVPAQN